MRLLVPGAPLANWSLIACVTTLRVPSSAGSGRRRPAPGACKCPSACAAPQTRASRHWASRLAGTTGRPASASGSKLAAALATGLWRRSCARVRYAGGPGRKSALQSHMQRYSCFKHIYLHGGTKYWQLGEDFCTCFELVLPDRSSSSSMSHALLMYCWAALLYDSGCMCLPMACMAYSY
jgi:hypothetical protein